MFDAFEVISFPGPLSHPWQPAATLCPLSPSLVPSMPGGASNRHVLCLSPNEQWKGHSSLYFQKQENCLHQLQWCLAQACVYKLLAHHLFWLRYFLQTNKTDRIQWGQSEMQRSGFPLIFTHFTLFFFNCIYLGRVSSWIILVWDQNQRCADMDISVQKLLCFII